jgi:hypothetical protein
MAGLVPAIRDNEVCDIMGPGAFAGESAWRRFTACGAR